MLIDRFSTNVLAIGNWYKKTIWKNQSIWKEICLEYYMNQRSHHHICM